MVGVFSHKFELAGVLLWVGEAILPLDLYELHELVERDLRDLFYGGELLQDCSACSSEDVREGHQSGVFACFQVKDTEAVRLLPGKIVNDVEPVSCKTPQREKGIIGLERVWQVSPHSESISNDESVDGICLVHLRVALFEVCYHSRVDGIKINGELIEERVLREGLEEVPPIDPSGFCSYLNGVVFSLGGSLDYLSDEGVGSRAVVICSRGRREDLTFGIHDTEGVGFSVQINAYNERISHFYHLFLELT